MKLPGLTRVLPPLAVVVAVGGAYGLASYGRPLTLGAGARAPSARSAAVTAVTRVCASPRTLPSSGVAVIAAPATRGPGRAQVTGIGQRGGPSVLTVTQPGQLSATGVRTSGAGGQGTTLASIRGRSVVPVHGGVVIRATGSMARGLEAEQTGPGAVPSARCGSPGTDFWFVGPGQRTAGHILLFLMNVSSQPADVTAEISTDAGPFQGGADAGIPVAAHSMVVQSLGTFVHGSHVLAVHVRTSVGQVAAAVEETKSGARAGVWLPAAQRPSTQVVLPGLPAVAGTRQLFLTVPGTQDAQIHLTAITTRGSYQPTGGTGLDIPGGSAVTIALPSLSGIPGAIKISSNVPVTASAMLTGGPPSSPGVLTAASGPIAQQGVVAENHTGSGEISELVLSAPGRAVKVRVTSISAGGSGGAAPIVKIGAHHSTVVQLKRRHGGRAAFSVVVTPLPGSGPLYAGQVVETSGTGGALQSILPVASALTTVPLPPVRDSFITAVP